MPKLPITESDIEELLAKTPNLTGGVTLESLQELHAQERKQALLAMDDMAKLFAHQDAERKKLWGNKFPRVLGAKPDSPPPTINPVKKKANNKRKAGVHGTR